MYTCAIPVHRIRNKSTLAKIIPKFDFFLIPSCSKLYFKVLRFVDAILFSIHYDNTKIYISHL